MGDGMSADFLPEQFWAATPEERVARCRQMAALAEHLAATASRNARNDYAELAKQWHVLADELETWNETSAGQLGARQRADDSDAA